MKSFRISGIVVYLLAFVVAALLYFNYMYIPMSAQIDKLNLEHTRDMAQISQYEMQLSRIDSLRANVAELDEKLQKARENSFVQPGETGDDVDKAFQACGLQPTSVSVSDVAEDTSGVVSSEGQPLCRLTVSLSFQSDVPRLLSLLDYFENQSQGAYFVDSLSQSAGEDGALTVSLAMTLYFFPQTEVAQ